MNLPATVNEFNAITDTDSRLAIELAVQIRPVTELLVHYNLSRSELAAKLKESMFRDMVKQAQTLWHSDLNIKERIRLKSQVLIEDSLLCIFQIIHDSNNAIPAKLDAFKQLSRVAEVDAPDHKQSATGDRFTVHINLGDTIAPIIIDSQAETGNGN